MRNLWQDYRAEAKPVRAEHNGTPILLVRRGSQIYALAETCSHLGGSLSEGKLDEDFIQCPGHGSRFSIRDGHVVDGPAVHPQPCLEARIRLKCAKPIARFQSHRRERKFEMQPRTGIAG